MENNVQQIKVIKASKYQKMMFKLSNQSELLFSHLSKEIITIIKNITILDVSFIIAVFVISNMLVKIIFKQ